MEDDLKAHIINLADPLDEKQASNMPVAEWMALGKKLYGEDMLKWKFKCPSCGHIQTPEDFRPFKDKGASPNTAYFDCIGRWLPEATGTMFNKKSPCDYTLGGLFKLSTRVVVDEKGARHATFMFADEGESK